MALSDIRLGTTIESVEACIVYRGKPFRLIVSSSVLQVHFGAGQNPDSWLDALKSHAITFERDAVATFRATRRSPVLIYKV